MRMWYREVEVLVFIQSWNRVLPVVQLWRWPPEKFC